MSDREQTLRNHLGQLQHAHDVLIRLRKDEVADLRRQRADMKQIREHAMRGEMTAIVAIVDDTLAYRERTQTPRKVKT
jgi:GTP1/Obg family GTP-binding protein